MAPDRGILHVRCSRPTSGRCSVCFFERERERKARSQVSPLRVLWHVRPRMIATHAFGVSRCAVEGVEGRVRTGSVELHLDLRPVGAHEEAHGRLRLPEAPAEHIAVRKVENAC
eukprot:2133106-Rhodomonas_salina.3